MLQIECEWMDHIYVYDFYFIFIFPAVFVIQLSCRRFLSYFFLSFLQSFVPLHTTLLFHFGLREFNICKMSIYIHDMYMQLVLSCFICLFSSHSNRSFVPSTFSCFTTFFFHLYFYHLSSPYTYAHETPDNTVRCISFYLYSCYFIASDCNI